MMVHEYRVTGKESIYGNRPRDESTYVIMSVWTSSAKIFIFVCVSMDICIYTYTHTYINIY